MRIRRGFVSNSSTTSFCIYGAILSDEFEDDAQDAGLDVNYGEPYGDNDSNIFVGLEWSSIKDHETGRQFKDRIVAAIEKFAPGEGQNYSTLEQAYRDG